MRGEDSSCNLFFCNHNYIVKECRLERLFQDPAYRPHCRTPAKWRQTALRDETDDSPWPGTFMAGLFQVAACELNWALSQMTRDPNLNVATEPLLVRLTIYITAMGPA
jgi:hypothetical protein